MITILFYTILLFLLFYLTDLYVLGFSPFYDIEENNISETATIDNKSQLKWLSFNR